MPENEKKGITVKVDAGLHAEVRQYIEAHGMTMAEFGSMALDNELHPKIRAAEEKNMETRRNMAFQVPEEMFQRIKEYLHRHHMTQKQFVLGLIEAELNRDMPMSMEQSSPAEQENDNTEVTENEHDEESYDEEYDESEESDEEESEDESMSMEM